MPGMDVQGELQPIVLTYLLGALMPGSPEIGNRNLRDMKTLARALDELLRGHVLQAADVLIQRLVAVEHASTEGSWNMSKFIELVPESNITAMPETERSMIAKLQHAEAKLRTPGTHSSPNRAGGRG